MRSSGGLQKVFGRSSEDLQKVFGRSSGGLQEIFFTTSEMRFGRTELKRGASKAKKSSESFADVHLSVAPQNPR